ncbi:MAG: nucleotidyltransferase domain-containing protein [Nitrososphaerota archaeon]|nr:nucleotidyltransferase domain-containing protein [Nitrososphaerota archaeon]
MVFGSYVRGEMKADSDVDVLLITNKAHNASYRGKIICNNCKKYRFCNTF